MATYLLDTSVIIDVLNGRRGRDRLLKGLLQAGHLLACCPINIMEVYAGMRPACPTKSGQQAALHPRRQALRSTKAQQPETT